MTLPRKITKDNFSQLEQAIIVACGIRPLDPQSLQIDNWFREFCKEHLGSAYSEAIAEAHEQDGFELLSSYDQKTSELLTLLRYCWTYLNTDQDKSMSPGQQSELVMEEYNQHLRDVAESLNEESKKTYKTNLSKAIQLARLAKIQNVDALVDSLIAKAQEDGVSVSDLAKSTQYNINSIIASQVVNLATEHKNDPQKAAQVIHDDLISRGITENAASTISQNVVRLSTASLSIPDAANAVHRSFETDSPISRATIISTFAPLITFSTNAREQNSLEHTKVTFSGLNVPSEIINELTLAKAFGDSEFIKETVTELANAQTPQVIQKINEQDTIIAAINSVFAARNISPEPELVTVLAQNPKEADAILATSSLGEDTISKVRSAINYAVESSASHPNPLVPTAALIARSAIENSSLTPKVKSQTIDWIKSQSSSNKIINEDTVTQHVASLGTAIDITNSLPTSFKKESAALLGIGATPEILTTVFAARKTILESSLAPQQRSEALSNITKLARDNSLTATVIGEILAEYKIDTKVFEKHFNQIQSTVSTNQTSSLVTNLIGELKKPSLINTEQEATHYALSILAKTPLITTLEKNQATQIVQVIKSLESEPLTAELLTRTGISDHQATAIVNFFNTAQNNIIHSDSKSDPVLFKALGIRLNDLSYTNSLPKVFGKLSSLESQALVKALESSPEIAIPIFTSLHKDKSADQIFKLYQQLNITPNESHYEIINSLTKTLSEFKYTGPVTPEHISFMMRSGSTIQQISQKLDSPELAPKLQQTFFTLYSSSTNTTSLKQASALLQSQFNILADEAKNIAKNSSDWHIISSGVTDTDTKKALFTEFLSSNGVSDKQFISKIDSKFIDNFSKINPLKNVAGLTIKKPQLLLDLATKHLDPYTSPEFKKAVINILQNPKNQQLAIYQSLKNIMGSDSNPARLTVALTRENLHLAIVHISQGAANNNQTSNVFHFQNSLTIALDYLETTTKKDALLWSQIQALKLKLPHEIQGLEGILTAIEKSQALGSDSGFIFKQKASGFFKFVADPKNFFKLKVGELTTALKVETLSSAFGNDGFIARAFPTPLRPYAMHFVRYQLGKKVILSEFGKKLGLDSLAYKLGLQIPTKLRTAGVFSTFSRSRSLARNMEVVNRWSRMRVYQNPMAFKLKTAFLKPKNAIMSKIASSSAGKAISALSTKIATKLGIQALGQIIGSTVPIIGNILTFIAGIVVEKIIKKVYDNIVKPVVKFIGQSLIILGITTGGIVAGFTGGASAIIVGGFVGVAGTIITKGASLSRIGSAIGKILLKFGTIVITAIATPVLISIFGIPIAIAFFLFIINSGAYVTPPNYGIISSVPGTSIVFPAGPGGVYPKCWPLNRSASPGQVVQGPPNSGCIGCSHTKPPQNAIDFSVSSGTPVYATHDGIFRSAYAPGICALGVVIKYNYGNYVTVTSTTGYTTLYAHLGSVAAFDGQTITAGTQIGVSGNSGCVDPHLHYELRAGGIDVRTIVPDYTLFQSSLLSRRNIHSVAKNCYAN